MACLQTPSVFRESVVLFHSMYRHVRRWDTTEKKKKNTKKVQISGKTGNNRKQLLQLNITDCSANFFFFTLAFLPALDSYSLVIRDTHFSSLFPRALFTI